MQWVPKQSQHRPFLAGQAPWGGVEPCGQPATYQAGRLTPACAVWVFQGRARWHTDVTVRG